MCSACHGFAGNSRGDTVPILAGADAAYLKKALADYAAGRRSSPEMEPYAKMAQHFGVDDIVAYFASQPRRATPVKADPAAAQRGRAAAVQCAVCHGADGKGDRAKMIPDLTGQPPGYLRNQLLLFKQDQRSPGDDPLKAVKLLIGTSPTRPSPTWRRTSRPCGRRDHRPLLVDLAAGSRAARATPWREQHPERHPAADEHRGERRQAAERQRRGVREALRDVAAVGDQSPDAHDEAAGEQLHDREARHGLPRESPLRHAASAAPRPLRRAAPCPR